MEQNRETFERVKKAAEYQKMAIHALFPDSVNEHLEVIENEMKAMLKDLVIEAVKAEMSKQMNSDFFRGFEEAAKDAAADRGEGQEAATDTAAHRGTEQESETDVDKNAKRECSKSRNPNCKKEKHTQKIQID